MNQPLATLTLPGRPIVKKNTQRKYGQGKSSRVVYGDKYLEWRARAISAYHRQPSIALLAIPVVAVYRFYFKDHQGEADVSNLCEAPGDLLKELGVLKDDRLIMRIQAEKLFGHEPRTEVELFRYEAPLPNG